MSPFPFHRPLLALAMGLSSLLLACRPAVEAPAPQVGRADRPKVLTTFLPITLFTRAVAGDCAEVTALIPAASGPQASSTNSSVASAGAVTSRGSSAPSPPRGQSRCSRKPSSESH